MNSDQAVELRRAYQRFQSAQLLAQAGQYNDAISRAYYVMFHVVEAFCLVKDSGSPSTRQ